LQLYLNHIIITFIVELQTKAVIDIQIDKPALVCMLIVLKHENVRDKFLFFFSRIENIASKMNIIHKI
jgi:hypothetical protein